MVRGDLIQFIDNCRATAVSSSQIPLWPDIIIMAGEIGVLLNSHHYHKIGTICEVLIGEEILYDIPEEKIKKLTAPLVERN